MSQSGDLLEKRRKELRITQEAFAMMCGINKSDIQDYISNGALPRDSRAAKIAIFCFENAEERISYIKALANDKAMKKNLPEKELIKLERDKQRASKRLIPASLVISIKDAEGNATGELFVEVEVLDKDSLEKIFKFSEKEGFHVFQKKRRNYIFARSENEEIIAFESICEELRLNPKSILSYIREWILEAVWLDVRNYGTEDGIVLRSVELDIFTNSTKKNHNTGSLSDLLPLEEIFDRQLIARMLEQKKYELLEMLIRIQKML